MSSNQQRGSRGGSSGGLVGGVVQPVTDVAGGVGKGLGKALSNIGESSGKEYDPSGISLYRQRMEREWPLPPHPRYRDQLPNQSRIEELLEQILQLLQQQQQR